MDERQWPVCTDLGKMLGFLRDKATDRKPLLFACACVRRVWSSIPDGAGRQAVEAAERFADGAASVDELIAALTALGSLFSRWGAGGAVHSACWFTAFDAGVASRITPASRRRRPYDATMAWQARCSARQAAVQQVASEVRRATSDAEDQAQAALLRDIFGNPFRPVAVDPAWLTWQDGMVARLAQAAYDNRTMPAGTLDLARLAVLADALEEAGCEDTDILGHLREPGVHVRGCHLLDLVLSKT